METLASILPYLNLGDWTVSIDLKDAYHHVPIAAQSRDLLGFTFNGRVYRFKALPFGLKPAPRIFTRLVGCVATFLRQRGLRIYCYLDDWLLVAHSPPLLRQHLAFLLRTVQAGVYYQLGQVEARPDSVPDVPRGDYRNPPTAGAAQPGEDRHYRGGGPAAPWSQDMAPVPGLPLESSRRPADCRLLMQPFQLHFLRNYRPGRDPLSRRVPLPPTIRLLFRRWSRPEILRSGNPLRVPQPTITVTTDASHMGWGGHCLGRNAYGDWSHFRVLPHINVLEFQAVILCLHHFLPLVGHRTVLIRTDNVTVAAYINKQGCTYSTRLNALAAELWTWCRGSRGTPFPRSRSSPEFYRR